MKVKTIILSVIWWLLSIFLIFYGAFGFKAIGYWCFILLAIGLFINPLVAIIMKKKFFYEIKNRLKVIVLLIAIILLALMKLKVISIPYSKNSDGAATTISIHIEN